MNILLEDMFLSDVITSLFLLKKNRRLVYGLNINSRDIIFCISGDIVRPSEMFNSVFISFIQQRDDKRLLHIKLFLISMLYFHG